MKKAISFLMIIFSILMFTNSLHADDSKPWGEYWLRMTSMEKFYYLSGLQAGQAIAINKLEHAYRSNTEIVLNDSQEDYKKMIKMIKDFHSEIFWQVSSSELLDVIKIIDNLYKDKQNNIIMFPYMVLFAINSYNGQDIDNNLKIYRYKISNPGVTLEEIEEKFPGTGNDGWILVK